MDASYACVMKLAPTRRPDWRWRRAQLMIDDHRRPTPRTDDAWTILANKYFRVKHHKTKRRDAALVRIESANELYQTDDERRLAIEAWLLAGLTIAEVAQRVNLPVELVESYEALFFNVTDRLKTRYWILSQAVGYHPNWEQENPPLKVFVRKLAYDAGPAIVEQALQAAYNMQNAVKYHPMDPFERKFRQLFLVTTAPLADPRRWQAAKDMLERNQDELVIDSAQLSQTMLASIHSLTLPPVAAVTPATSLAERGPAGAGERQAATRTARAADAAAQPAPSKEAA